MNDPLSNRNRDLAEIAAASKPDVMLSMLADTVGGTTHVLGLLANGMTIYGRTVSPREMATMLDAENERMFARSSTEERGTQTNASERIRNLWTTAIEKQEADEWELVSHTSGDIDELPEELGRKIIRGQQSTLTLEDVRVFPPGCPAFVVPLLRVRLSTVSGWWLVPTDKDGHATYTHPTPNFGGG
jgi:hypothetical protein